MLKKKRVCIIRRAYYPQESHVRRNAETLVNAGFDVYLVCLKKAGEKRFENINGVNTYRIPLSAKRKGIASYLMEYICFFLISFVYVSILHLNHKFDFVEADSMPDFLVFCGLIPKITGAKVVLYMFENMPEIYADKYKLSMKHPMVKVIRIVEYFSMSFADRIIATHERAKLAFQRNGAHASKITVVLNVPDERIFDRKLYASYEKEQKRGFTLITHGTITEVYGIQTIIKAIDILKKDIRHLKLNIVGDGEYRIQLFKLVDNLRLHNHVKFTGHVPFETIPKMVMDADVGVVSILIDYMLPNKLFELAALGKPAIVPDLPTLRPYFGDDSVMYYKPGNEGDLARCISELYRNPKKKFRLGANISSVYERCRWENMKNVYHSVYENLT